MDRLTPEWLSQVVWKRVQALPDRSFRWGRVGDDYVGEWDGVLVVRADSMGSVKSWIASPTTSTDLVDKLKQGEAMAFVRALQGRLSVHASAVLLGGCAILLTGTSGTGKSTLASQVCCAFGASLLADDVAGLEIAHGRLRVEPSERAVWLDAGKGDKSPTPLRVAKEPGDLALFVVLRFDDTLATARVRKLRGADVVTGVLEGLLRFDPAPDLWRREFDLLTRVVRDVQVLEIARPRSVSAARVSDLLVELAQPHARDRKVST